MQQIDGCLAGSSKHDLLGPAARAVATRAPTGNRSCCGRCGRRRPRLDAGVHRHDGVASRRQLGVDVVRERDHAARADVRRRLPAGSRRTSRQPRSRPRSAPSPPATCGRPTPARPRRRCRRRASAGRRRRRRSATTPCRAAAAAAASPVTGHIGSRRRSLRRARSASSARDRGRREIRRGQSSLDRSREHAAKCECRRIDPSRQPPHRVHELVQLLHRTQRRQQRIVEQIVGASRAQSQAVAVRSPRGDMPLASASSAASRPGRRCCVMRTAWSTDWTSDARSTAAGRWARPVPRPTAGCRRSRSAPCRSPARSTWPDVQITMDRDRRGRPVRYRLDQRLDRRPAGVQYCVRLRVVAGVDLVERGGEQGRPAGSLDSSDRPWRVARG